MSVSFRRRPSAPSAAPRRSALPRGLVLGALLLVAGPLRAQAVIHVPGDELTIQDAIFQASDGDTIDVAAGSYPEAIDFFGLSISVRSIDGAGVTTIDATGLGQAAVRISGTGPGTLLEGFTIRGGDGTGGLGWGGGLEIDGATVTVKDCVIANNEADSGGGVAVFSGSDADFEGCTFRGNHADTNGGGAYVNSANATFTDCVIRKNTANNGGGLNANFGADVELVGCRILKNTAANSGGGVQVIAGFTGSAMLTGCSLEENTASQAGGLGVNGTSATITDCDFLNNHATSLSSTAGGGLQAQGTGALSVTDSRFTGNRAQVGGGLQLISFLGTATISGCDFSENVADFQGGGLYCSSSSTGSLSGCSFSNNQAVAGGGVLNSAGNNLAIGTTLTCNNSPDNISGAFLNQGGNTTTQFCNGWTDLGYAHAGSNGVPRLEGTGTLSVGQPGALTLTDARPSALAVLFVSFNNAPTPFFNGTLVPVPPQLEVSLFTDGAGDLDLPFVWPSGVPTGFDIYQQFGIDDPGALGGVALSNALKSEAL